MRATIEFVDLSKAAAKGIAALRARLEAEPPPGISREGLASFFARYEAALSDELQRLLQDALDDEQAQQGEEEEGEEDGGEEDEDEAWGLASYSSGSENRVRAVLQDLGDDDPDENAFWMANIPTSQLEEEYRKLLTKKAARDATRKA